MKTERVHRINGAPCRHRYLDYFDSQVETILQSLKICRATFGTESFHDFRVGVKRWRAFIEMIASFNPGFDIMAGRAAINPIYRAAGKIRDLHVRMNLIRDRGPAFVAGLSGYYSYLKHRESAMRRKFTAVAGEFKPTTMAIMRANINDYLSLVSDTTLIERTRGFLYELSTRLIILGTHDTCSEIDYHNLRILTKQTRYTLEVFRLDPSVSETFNSYDDSLRETHQVLGAWHDMVGEIESLGRFRDSHHINNEAMYDTYANDLIRQKEALVSDIPGRLLTLMQFQHLMQ